MVDPNLLFYMMRNIAQPVVVVPEQRLLRQRFIPHLRAQNVPHTVQEFAKAAAQLCISLLASLRLALQDMGFQAV